VRQGPGAGQGRAEHDPEAERDQGERRSLTHGTASFAGRGGNAFEGKDEDGGRRPGLASDPRPYTSDPLIGKAQTRRTEPRFVGFRSVAAALFAEALASGRRLRGRSIGR